MFSRDTVDTLQGHVTIQEIKSSQRPHYTKRYGLGWYPATEKKGWFKYTSCTKNGIILIILVVTTDTAVCGMASRFFPVHPQLKPPRPQVWCVFTDIYIYALTSHAEALLNMSFGGFLYNLHVVKLFMRHALQ